MLLIFKKDKRKRPEGLTKVVGVALWSGCLLFRYRAERYSTNRLLIYWFPARAKSEASVCIIMIIAIDSFKLIKWTLSHKKKSSHYPTYVPERGLSNTVYMIRYDTGSWKRMYHVNQQTVACWMSLRRVRSFSAMCSVARLFLRVAYVGYLFKQRGIHSV